MNILNTKKNEIAVVLNKAMSECDKNCAKKLKIERFNKVCESIVTKGAELKVVLVVSYLTQEGIKISKQSIYNKCGGDNYYRKLYDLWCEYSFLKKQAKKNNIAHNGGDIVKEEDLEKIDDPVFRHKISLMYGEIKSLRKQNDLLRQAKDFPAIHSVPSTEILQTRNTAFLLNEYEIDVIKSFIDGRLELKFDDEGKLIANSIIRKGASLSAQGLREALEKILYNQEALGYEQ